MKTLQKILVFVAVFCTIQNITAQGEQLFKAKCNVKIWTIIVPIVVFQARVNFIY